MSKANGSQLNHHYTEGEQHPQGSPTTLFTFLGLVPLGHLDYTQKAEKFQQSSSMWRICSICLQPCSILYFFGDDKGREEFCSVSECAKQLPELNGKSPKRSFFVLLLAAVQVGWAAQSNCSKKVQESQFKGVTVLGNRKTHQTVCEEGNKAQTQEPGGIFKHVYLTMYRLGFVSWLGIREIHKEGFFE